MPPKSEVKPRPLTGRELYEMHRAMIDAGFSPCFRLRWLAREAAIWKDAQDG